MKRKVLVIASTFPRWENDTLPPFVYDLSKRLTKEFDISVLAPHYPDSKTDEVMDNLKVHRFRYFFNKYEKLAGSGGILPTLKNNKWFYFQVPFFLLGEFLSLRKIIKQEHPEIIHAHWIIPQGLVVYINNKLSTKKNKVPYVVTTHGGDIFGLKGFNLIKKPILKNAYKITVVSNAIKQEVLEKIDKNLDIEVIPMGVDTNLFNPNKKDQKLKKEYKIDRSFLLFVGRLAEKKGVKYLIEAMPEVIKKFPKTKLLIVGTGVLEDDLKQQTKELKLERNIIFTGAIQNKELPKYYATADIFIGPSIIAKGGDTEGFGLTFVEAGMSGCFLIGTNVGGISDIIKNGKNGVIVKEKDSKELSKELIKSINKKTSTPQKNRKLIVNLFDYDIISKRYIGVLR